MLDCWTQLTDNKRLCLRCSVVFVGKRGWQRAPSCRSPPRKKKGALNLPCGVTYRKSCLRGGSTGSARASKPGGPTSRKRASFRRRALDFPVSLAQVTHTLDTSAPRCPTLRLVSRPCPVSSRLPSPKVSSEVRSPSSPACVPPSCSLTVRTASAKTDTIGNIPQAAQGIGKACAILFAKEGAKVVVADLDEGTSRDP